MTILLPDEAHELPQAEAETLADLVDFAIDTDNAVVERPDAEEFSVVHDGYRYVYRPPSLPTSEPEAVERADDRDDGEETGEDGQSDEPTAVAN